MDCFLLEGIEVIFRLALALLTIGKPNLLVYDMEGVIRVREKHTKEIWWDNITSICQLCCFPQYFQKDMPARFESDPEEVMNLAFSIKINQKKMKKMEKEYTTMKTKEKEDEIELRV